MECDGSPRAYYATICGPPRYPEQDSFFQYCERSKEPGETLECLKTVILQRNSVLRELGRGS